MQTINLKKFEAVLAVLIILGLMISGCGGSKAANQNQNGGNPQIPATPPNNSTPPPLAPFGVITALPQGTDAGLDPKVSLTFNRVIADTPLTVTVRDLTRQLNVPVSEIIPDGTREGLAIAMDLNRLLGSTHYRITVQGLESAQGERLENNEYSWEFTTGRPQGETLVHSFTLPSASEALGIFMDEDENRYVAGSVIVERDRTQSDTDALVAMFDASGALVWQRLFASPSVEYATAITKDSTGAIYVAGSTNGSLERANAGSYDIFLAKYNVYGVREWIIQYGDTDFEAANGIASDPSLGVVYVVGSTFHPINSQTNGLVFLYYPEQGRRVPLQIANAGTGTATTVATDIALASNGQVYVSGYTNGSLPNYSNGVRNGNHPNGGVNTADAFWYRYNPQGIGILDTVQFGRGENDRAKSIALKETPAETRVVIAGITDGRLYDLNRGSLDIFIAQYLPSAATHGPLLESSLQTGTADYDDVFDLISHPNASVNEYVIGGVTTGAFTGFRAPATGEYDAFVSTVFFNDGNGELTLQNLRQSQSPVSQVAYGIALSGSGAISVMANTSAQPGSGLGTIAYYHDFYQLPIIIR